MVNIATIALTHAIMLIAAWRLLLRRDLDRDPPAPEVTGKSDAAHSAKAADKSLRA